MATEKSNIDKNWFDDQLSLYLRGKLSTEEETELLTLLKSDEILKARAVAVARLSKGLQQVGSERDRATIAAFENATLEDIKNAAVRKDAKIEADIQEKAKIVHFKPKRFILSVSVAASILLCIFGGYKYYQYNQITSLGYEYLAYIPSSEIYRGEHSNVDSQLEAIKSDIQSKKNIETSITTLEDMWRQSISDEYTEYTAYMPEIGWMLANAYLCDNSKDKASDILDILITEYSTESAIGNKARELKEKISKI
jgi:hypothetical protein